MIFNGVIADIPTGDFLQHYLHLGIGAILSLLLWNLAARSTGQGRRARLGFAACGLLFTGCAVIGRIAHSADPSHDPWLSDVAGKVAFCTSSVWPLTILLLWYEGPFRSEARRRIGTIFLALAASATLVTCVTFLLSGQSGFTADPVKYHERSIHGPEICALIILWLGAFIYLPGRMKGRLSRWSVVALLTGISIYTSGHLAALLGAAWLIPAATWLKPFALTLIIVGGLFGFSEFRFTDIFAQRGLQVVIGSALALFVAGSAQLVSRSWPFDSGNADVLLAVHFTLTWAALIGYVTMSRWTNRLVDRQIFRSGDYQRALDAFREQIAARHDQSEILRLACELAKRTLRIADATIHAGQGLAEPIDLSDMIDLGSKFCFNIVGGKPNLNCLEITPGPRRLTLFHAEIDFLRELCQITSRQLELILHETEQIGQVRREEQLINQLVEAELRALRAQVNPHFLFNSLNSVASLIPSDPAAAERMVLRLSTIFRHVLIYADRPFSSVSEEVSFLRNYLEIERARFGERLNVVFEVEPAIEHLPVPTLILQPLVENAIKHGLAPKLGLNQLIIRARSSACYLILTVEDNGMGTAVAAIAPWHHDSTGLGLRNVAERLQTVYQGAATLAFESVPRLGSRAQISIPLPAP